MTAKAKKAQEYPGRAVLALSKLDDGNRLIERCRAFLEHFSNVLGDPGKLSLTYIPINTLNADDKIQKLIILEPHLYHP